MAILPSELLAHVGHAVRRMGAQGAMTDAAAAARLNLHTTDLECLDLIYLNKDQTAGEIAKATGLTSGAVTALIDRLEAAGYVERVVDSTDRRRIHVHIRPEAIKSIEAVYAPMQEKMFALWSEFSERDLRMVVEFISRSADLAGQCVDEMSRAAPAFRPKRRAARAGRIA